jgi:thiamine-monophosphate kinase
LQITLPKEFELISRHFTHLAGPGALGLTDDAAVITPPANRQLVISADAMVQGVHFLPDDPPETIGRKLLRANLSDLAAMGAEPLGYLLTVSVPKDTPDAWFAGFAAGLAQDQAQFGITLLGGDTTSTPGPISLSATVLGHVAPGAALTRAGARPGDGIYVTGTIGDGALGLRALRGELADADGFLSNRYRLPQPRLGLSLAGIASAAMDVSDGLLQDLAHLCRASGVGAEVQAAHVPRSAAARAAGPSWLPLCLTGGDDYELLLAVPASAEAALLAEAERAQVPMTRIGRFVEDARHFDVLDASGETMVVPEAGWSHF